MAFASTNTEKFYHGFPTPGPQNPTVNQVMSHVYFADEATWKKACEETVFDYIVIGSGFCSYAFVQRIVYNAKITDAPCPKILILERGSFFLPEHFQNLPLAFKNATPQQKFMNETFPWTLGVAPATCDPAKGFKNDGAASWMHGMVPFFGGRSTLWSGWCPRPLGGEYHELDRWPVELTNMMTAEFFEGAEKILGVASSNDLVHDKLPAEFRIYNTMQKTLFEMLDNTIKTNPTRLKSAKRVIYAPLAVSDEQDKIINFDKFSVVGAFLNLIYEQKKDVTAVVDCVVDKIIHQDTVVTALSTSRGILPVSKNTKIVLAVGCMPAATLLLNSYPSDVIPNVGKKFAAHIITAITAKVSIKAFPQFNNGATLNPFELGAFYVAGIADNGLSYHAQISILRSNDFDVHRAQALRYMPDVVATAPDDAMAKSEGDIVFVLAILGELDATNPNNKFTMLDPNAADKTSNCRLDYSIADTDKELWDVMDKVGIDIVEQVFAGGNTNLVTYWKAGDVATSTEGAWLPQTDAAQKVFRVPGMVHESCVVNCGNNPETDAVSLDFRPYGTKSVYVTGSGLWPTGCSWNPTMTMCGFAQKLADDLEREHRNDQNDDLESEMDTRSTHAAATSKCY